MSLGQWIARTSGEVVRQEISAIAGATGVSSKQVAEDALKVARSFLALDELAHPVTLARASFFIALKKSVKNPEGKIQAIIHANGQPDRWWVYLVPVIERQIATK